MRNGFLGNDLPYTLTLTCLTGVFMRPHSDTVRTQRSSKLQIRADVPKPAESHKMPQHLTAECEAD